MGYSVIGRMAANDPIRGCSQMKGFLKMATNPWCVRFTLISIYIVALELGDLLVGAYPLGVFQIAQDQGPQGALAEPPDSMIW